MITLLQATFKNGWSNVAYAIIDAKGIGIVPERDYQPAWGIFMVIFVLFGSLLLSELFLCVIFESFYSTKLEYCGASACNLYEQQWINIQRFMLRRNLRYF